MNQVNNGLTPIYPYNTFPHNSTLPGEERSEMDLIYDSKGKRRSQGAEVSLLKIQERLILPKEKASPLRLLKILWKKVHKRA